MLSSIPKSTNDIDIKTITQYVESIRIKVKNIFNSIEESFNNKNSNDGW